MVFQRSDAPSTADCDCVFRTEPDPDYAQPVGRRLGEDGRFRHGRARVVGRSLRDRRVALGRKLLPSFVRGNILKLRMSWPVVGFSGRGATALPTRSRGFPVFSTAQEKPVSKSLHGAKEC